MIEDALGPYDSLTSRPLHYSRLYSGYPVCLPGRKTLEIEAAAVAAAVLSDSDPDAACFRLVESYSLISSSIVVSSLSPIRDSIDQSCFSLSLSLSLSLSRFVLF